MRREAVCRGSRSDVLRMRTEGDGKMKQENYINWSEANQRIRESKKEDHEKGPHEENRLSNKPSVLNWDMAMRSIHQEKSE